MKVSGGKSGTLRAVGQSRCNEIGPGPGHSGAGRRGELW